MIFSDIKSLSYFVAGNISMFSIAGSLLMSPPQMISWLKNGNSSDVKVERALAKPSQQILDLESEVNRLLNDSHQIRKMTEKNEQSTLNEKTILQKTVDTLKKEKKSLVSELENIRADSLTMKTKKISALRPLYKRLLGQILELRI
jgi:uncharacterized protein (DUF3084 family)